MRVALASLDERKTLTSLVNLDEVYPGLLDERKTLTSLVNLDEGYPGVFGGIGNISILQGNVRPVGGEEGSRPRFLAVSAGRRSTTKRATWL